MFKRKYPSNPCHSLTKVQSVALQSCSFLSVVPSTSSAVPSALPFRLARQVIFINNHEPFTINHEP